MEQQWLEKLKWWLCEKSGHCLDEGWHYSGQHHRNCKWCGRVISKQEPQS